MSDSRMRFKKPVTDVIRERRSCRSYDGRTIDDASRKELEGCLSRLDKGPFAAPVRIQLVDRSGPSWRTRAFGTYGFISGARQFLAGAVVKSGHDLEDFGFVFEEALLHATDLGLSTCWLGGTFNRSSFARAVKLHDNEMLPAISPVGYGRARRGALDSAMYRVVGSAHRRPWTDLFFYKDFDTPIDEGRAGGYSLPLEMVRLAPSAVNGQPWRVVKAEGSDLFHFYLKRAGMRKGTADVFVHFDLQRIDMGIAMCHFDLAAKELGLRGEWKVVDPGPGSVPGEMEYVVSWAG